MSCVRHMLKRLHTVIQTARPGMTVFPRAILDAILLSEGSIGSARFVADELRLGSRFRLARLLKREGLPSLRRLAGWAAIDGWVSAAEREGTSLFRLALRWHRHPSACYRLVKEVTGVTWGEVRKRGSEWVEREILSEIRPSSSNPPTTRTAPQPRHRRSRGAVMSTEHDTKRLHNAVGIELPHPIASAIPSC